MENVLFIDCAAIMYDATRMPSKDACDALKTIAKKVGNLQIVCLNTEAETAYYNYDLNINALSQMLGIEKSCFGKATLDNNTTDCAAYCNAISKWMAGKCIKSFAIVKHSESIALTKTYPNNTIICHGMLSASQANDVLWTLSNFKHPLKDGVDVWFVSDTHFGHANIIKYCSRPWNSGKDANGDIIVSSNDVLAMDNALIERWNAVVKKNDIVWHLGDFALGGKSVAERVFPQLNGKINLVMGNHDHWGIKWYYDLGFNRVYDRNVVINDYVILSHVPLMFLNGNTPFFNIYGHIHDSTAYQTWTKTSSCVCVERHNYYPVSWKTIKEKYEELNGEHAQ